MRFGSASRSRRESRFRSERCSQLSPSRQWLADSHLGRRHDRARVARGRACAHRAGRRRLYFVGVAGVGRNGVSCSGRCCGNTGSHPFWPGPIVPVLGELTVTREELRSRCVVLLRFAAVGLASAAYALLLDHDRLLGAASWARRSAFSVALATRLVPDARARRGRSGRGAAWPGARGRRLHCAGEVAVAAAGRIARAGTESRRGDGGAQLRAGRPHAGAGAVVDECSTGWRSRPQALIALGAVWL